MAFRSPLRQMADLYEPDCGTAFYRSLDPIKNFKIRITLERVTSASIVPQAQIEKEAGGDVEMQQIKMRQNFGGQKDVEQYTFSWQEKVFSKREVGQYEDEHNCLTVLERKYHQDTKPFREGRNRSTKRLFSYVEHDAFTNRDDNARKVTTSPTEKPTVLAEKMLNLRQRRTASSKNKILQIFYQWQWENIGVPRLNIVDYDPAEELRKQNHLLSTPVTTMYIMADLTHLDREPTEESEHVLATIKFDANGVVSIKPDYNKGKKPYRVQSLGIGRDVFEYTIEHASKKMTSMEQDKERRMFKELYTRHTEYLTSLVGHDFEMPQRDCLRLLCYGEIVSAQNFEYDDLYIHYFMELPQYWHPVGMPHLSGVTQVCRTKTIGRDEVAYFSFPFHFEFVYKNDSLDENLKQMTLPKWPQLYVEVLSLDSWERYRTEGYGHVTLPSSPGLFTETIHCWRPAGRSCFAELRRYFIGGTPELEDLTYISVPSTFEGKNLSKFGFRTISTGSVTVKLNIMQQSQAFLRTASSKKKQGTLFERLGASTAQANIMTVLEAFMRAKKVMVAARENLRHDYVETLHALDDNPLDDD